MKKLFIIFIFMSFFITGFGQEVKVDEYTNKYYIEEKIWVEDSDASSLLLYIIKWIDSYYHSPLDKIIYVCQNELILQGGYHTNTFCGSGVHSHTLSFQIRDNVISLKYTDFVFTSLLYPDIVYDNIEWTPEDEMKFNENISEINKAILSLINSIKNEVGEDKIN